MLDFPYWTRLFHHPASEALPDREGVLLFTSAGGAKPIAGRGGLKGLVPSAHFMARTAAFDGQRIFTRAARSAPIRFAVRSLSQVMDRGRTKAGARVGTSSTANAVPLPLEGKA